MLSFEVLMVNTGRIRNIYRILNCQICDASDLKG